MSLSSRQDVQPTFHRIVSSIKYVLDEVEGLRRKYQLKPSYPFEEVPQDKRGITRDSSSAGTNASLRQRILKNQKQKSFLVITKWTLRDGRRFQENVTRLKRLIDGLENITKAARLTSPESSEAVVSSDDDPPPYSAEERLSLRESPGTESFHQEPLAVEAIVPTNTVLSEASLSALAGHHSIMERFMSDRPDKPGNPRLKVRRRLRAFSIVQFQELSQDVHDEVLRRQQLVPACLPHSSLFHPKRNAARKQLSTIVHFSQLVTDIVFEYKRRLPFLHSHVGLPPIPSLPSPVIFPNENPRRWGVIYPSPRPQYRDAHQSIQAGLSVSVQRPPRLSNLHQEQVTSVRNVKESQDSERHESDNWTDCEVRWPLNRILTWLKGNQFSNEWQKTFEALNIRGAIFLELGNDIRAGSDTGIMHRLVYPRLALEFSTSGKVWDQAKGCEEGDRLRRLVGRISSLAENPQPWTRHPPSVTASVEIFKTFRVSMEDPTYKILPAALRKYNINAPWEQYALYIVSGEMERCLGMEEKPLRLFKQLDKEGKKPLFMLRKIASSIASATSVVDTPVAIV